MMIQEVVAQWVKDRTPSVSSKREAYLAGFDCGKNGANLDNCNYRLFSSQELTNCWSDGKKDAAERKRVSKTKYVEG